MMIRHKQRSRRRPCCLCYSSQKNGSQTEAILRLLCHTFLYCDGTSNGQEEDHVACAIRRKKNGFREGSHLKITLSFLLVLRRHKQRSRRRPCCLCYSSQKNGSQTEAILRLLCHTFLYCDGTSNGQEEDHVACAIRRKKNGFREGSHLKITLSFLLVLRRHKQRSRRRPCCLCYSS